MEIKIQSVHFDADVKLLEFIEKKISKLQTFYDHILAVDVILKLENYGQDQDKVTEIILTVPGNKLLAKENCKSFEEGTDLCVDVLKRQLVKYKEKHRDH